MGKTRKQTEAEKELYKNTTPIIKIKPEFGTGTAKFKIIGLAEIGNKVEDDIVEIDTDQKTKDKYGANIVHICDVDEYTATGKIYSCNIQGNYIMKHTKIPMFYMKIGYERKFLSGQLFSIRVSFKISHESIEKMKDPMKDPKKYLQSSLRGEYIIELITDDDFLDEFIKHIKPKYEKKITEEELNGRDPDSLPENEMDEIVKKIYARLDERIDKYINLLNPMVLQTYPHKNTIMKHLMETCKNEYFVEMVKECILMRDKVRKSNAEPTFNSKIPKRIFRIKELKDNPEKVDELLNDTSLDRSSEETDYSDSD